jgi:hypothetical protein
MSENFQLVYQSRRKCEIHRDTGVSKHAFLKKYCNLGHLNDNTHALTYMYVRVLQNTQHLNQETIMLSILSFKKFQLLFFQRSLKNQYYNFDENN